MTDLSESDSWWCIECPCCGCDAAFGPGDRWTVYDGQPLLCGCRGHINVDTESEPEVFIDDCDCESATHS